MPIQETPAAGKPGDRRLLSLGAAELYAEHSDAALRHYRPDPLEVDRLAAILTGHRCFVWAKASGTTQAMNWTCSMCGSVLPVGPQLSEASWLFEMALRDHGRMPL